MRHFSLISVKMTWRVHKTIVETSVLKVHYLSCFGIVANNLESTQASVFLRGLVRMIRFHLFQAKEALLCTKISCPSEWFQ